MSKAGTAVAIVPASAKLVEDDAANILTAMYRQAMGARRQLKALVERKGGRGDVVLVIVDEGEGDRAARQIKEALSDG